MKSGYRPALGLRIHTAASNFWHDLAYNNMLRLNDAKHRNAEYNFSVEMAHESDNPEAYARLG